jgi:hypothetical protein
VAAGGRAEVVGTRWDDVGFPDNVVSTSTSPPRGGIWMRTFPLYLVGAPRPLY